MRVDLDELPSDRNRHEHNARRQIRKQTLDPYNRIHSIAEDIEFIQIVHEKHYSSYPLLANLRCGAWYCDPRKAGGVTSHFKSADGHYNGWSFNLRRPNLHIIPLIQDSGGICIVDATRSGKRMPDSLSKTIPIWSAVINRALKLRGFPNSIGWDTQFYTPPQSVSRQEHDQIEIRLDNWAESLANSSYQLPRLEKPLRPIWITPASTTFPGFDQATPFLPVICISASRIIVDGAERRTNGYSYVQGAGDDHENWNEGLTPEIFWEHRHELLEAAEHDFPDALRRIVLESHSTPRSSGHRCRLPTPIAHVKGLLSITALKDFPDSPSGRGITANVAEPHLILREQPDTLVPTPIKETMHEVSIPKDKKTAQRAFKACLADSLCFIQKHIKEGRRVCIACETGKDFSVGVALVALQTFFDDNGELRPDLKSCKHPKVTKESLRTRLHWIISSRPEANPSRATLKMVNEFFMSPLPSHTTRKSNKAFGDLWAAVENLTLPNDKNSDEHLPRF